MPGELVTLLMKWFWVTDMHEWGFMSLTTWGAKSGIILTVIRYRTGSQADDDEMCMLLGWVRALLLVLLLPGPTTTHILLFCMPGLECCRAPELDLVWGMGTIGRLSAVSFLLHRNLCPGLFGAAC